jgi:hypothetical protein
MTSEYLMYQACARVQYWARYNIQQSNHKSEHFQRSSLFSEQLKECHLESGIVLECLRAKFQRNAN